MLLSKLLLFRLNRKSRKRDGARSPEAIQKVDKCSLHFILKKKIPNEMVVESCYRHHTILKFFHQMNLYEFSKIT